MKRRQPNGRRARPKRMHSRLRALLVRIRPSAKLRRRVGRVLAGVPLPLQAALGLTLAVMLCFALNWIYQVVRKPSELLFPVSGTLNKAPAETWRQYFPLFQKYSTNEISPSLLAALAQVEGSGNPVVRTYWRWSLRPGPFDIYRPASSAVGMYQITDGTFAEARRFCIRDHRVVEDGPWNDWASCWFNNLYTRVIPAHAVELTAAYLDRSVAAVLAHHRLSSVSPERKDELAAMIHLCGAGAGNAYVRRGMRLTDEQRCGDHEARLYITRVMQMKRLFEAMRDPALPYERRSNR